jgi:hypothetical protein
LDQNIVFITGAGASVPYKYPIGSDLVNKIRTELSSTSSELYRFLTGTGRGLEESRMLYGLPKINEYKVKEFRENFIMNGAYSIDEFLSTNYQEYGYVGKLCISYILKKCETFENLYPVVDSSNKKNSDWLRYLINEMFGQGESLGPIENLTFVTFNYDRVFEYKLFNALKTRGAINFDMLKNIRLHHVYGSIGGEPWNLIPEREPEYEFGLERKNNYWEFQAHASAKGIKVFTDPDQREAPIPESYKSHIYNAQKIFILGFGFNETNLERLGLDWERVRGKVYATHYGISETQELYSLCEKYKINTEHFHNVGCMDLLTMYMNEDVELSNLNSNKVISKRKNTTIVKKFEEDFIKGKV